MKSQVIGSLKKRFSFEESLIIFLPIVRILYIIWQTCVHVVLPYSFANFNGFLPVQGFLR